MTPLLKGFKAATRPADRRTPWQWCESHIVVDNTSPMPGRWRSDNSPWVKEAMEVVADNRVSDIAIKCSAQSSKTQTFLNLACWCISEDPGPAMWVMAAKDEAETFVRDRVAPTFKNCRPVEAAKIRESKLEFTFATMPFYFVGAGSPSKLQSKPIRWLFLDEVRNYPPGALDTVLKRTRAFWNSRRLIISTPDLENDAVDRAYKAGDQRVFHFECPGCSQLQPLKFEQLKWETNETTKPGGRWDFDALAQTIRYVCVSCGHAIKDTPAERKAIARKGRFVRTNPHAPRHRVSFHWNALLPPWVSWRSIVEEFIAAKAALRTGDTSPFKTFVNETLGESWEDQLGAIDDYDFLDARKQDYDFGDPWPEESDRFMAADRQEAGGEHYWYVIRAFGPFGKSCLVTYGRCATREQLEELRKAHNVPVTNAIIDSGFKASEVYRFCLATGWKAFKGDDTEYFLHKDPATNRSVRRIWQRTFVDPFFGARTAVHRRAKPLPLFRWSNNATKDLLAEYMMGLVGDWTIPAQIGRDYLKQVTAERREEKEDTAGRIHYFWKQVRRDNHLLDCELMIIVAAVITKLITTKESSAKVLNPG